MSHIKTSHQIRITLHFTSL